MFFFISFFPFHFAYFVVWFYLLPIFASLHFNPIVNVLFFSRCVSVCVCIMHILSSVSIFSFEKNIVFIWSLVFITIITKRLVGGIFFCFPLVSLFGSCGSSGGGCDVHVLKIAEKKETFLRSLFTKDKRKTILKKAPPLFLIWFECVKFPLRNAVSILFLSIFIYKTFKSQTWKEKKELVVQLSHRTNRMQWSLDKRYIVLSENLPFIQLVGRENFQSHKRPKRSEQKNPYNDHVVHKKYSTSFHW